ncbi:MAG: lipopolysaccharide-modifying protein, partial [Rhizobiales bacterium]|nr:lipopolysaccharide-modifying protein [Hyphomicrobiales bacterium]
LYTRMLLGCCVLKVASPSGFRQWFYDEFVPWTHYIPVAADLSDIVEKVEWCRAHDQACREIAEAGQDLAQRQPRESETIATVQRINDRLAPG